MEWLLQEDHVREMQEMKRAGFAPTAEQITAFVERQREEEKAEGMPRNLTVAGAEAEILVEGVLTEKPRFFFFREGTTFRDIRSALAIADADPNVKRAVLRVNSPGGTVDGLFDTIAAIEQFSKPLRAVCNKAQSAAFALAAAAGKIEAAGKASEFGSIGIVTTFVIFEDEITLTNTDSPEKRPDPTTEEGKASIVAHLDAINELFVEAIASGRSRAGKATSVTGVKTGFGRGATLLAKEAKRAGMIDRITGQKPVLTSVTDDDDDSADMSATDNNNTPQVADTTTRTETMDLTKLKADHPELFETVRKAAYDAGSIAERERCKSHLILGEQSGDLKTAHEAIMEGTEMTPSLQAKYMAAGMARADKGARQTETDAAGGAADDGAAAAAAAAAEAAKGSGDLGDQVVAQMENGKGAAA